MTRAPSKARQRAEIAFDEAQSQFLARKRAVEGAGAPLTAQAEKTMRLREARLARDIIMAPVVKRAR